MARRTIGTVIVVAISAAIVYKLIDKYSDGDTFCGKKREIAKTCIASGYPTYYTISELYRYLPSDSRMENRYNVTDDSPRSAPEQKNVTITGWLFTYVYEDDADYHLIIGNSSDADHARFFSAEISGLPDDDSPNYKFCKRLKKARDQFMTLISGKPERPSNYVKSLYNQPIKVRVTGSLYWDTEHTGGRCCSGPEGYKSEGAWEIHPVTDIRPAY